MLFLILCALLVILLTIYIKWNFSYWRRLGFPHVDLPIPFGALDPVRRQTRSLGMAIYDLYVKSEEKVLGIFFLFRPALLVRDAEIARKILLTDYKNFYDRGIYVDEKRDPMSGTLLNLRGRNWKEMRETLAPSFTSGKLKAMFETTFEISERMLKHINSLLPDDQGSVLVDMKKICVCYAIDIIASVIYGLENDSFKEPDNDFYKLNGMFNAPTFISILHRTCEFLYPNFLKIMVFCGFEDRAATIINNLVRRTIEYREKNNIIRKDMLQLLLQVRNNGQVNTDENCWNSSNIKSSNIKKNLSIDKIAAQLYLFYVAGFETTSSTIAYTIYELSKHPEKLKKAQEDVEMAINKHGKLNYEAIWDMKYLQVCVQETIRKYPALPILNRECTADYKIPDTNLTIKQGTPIIISLLGIHRDEKYFPNAMGYEPERFLEENMNYDPTAYMPFGEGPRHCIAQRMGIMNVKLAIAKILANFKLESNSNQSEIEFKTYGVVLLPRSGITVRLSKK